MSDTLQWPLLCVLFGLQWMRNRDMCKWCCSMRPRSSCCARWDMATSCSSLWTSSLPGGKWSPSSLMAEVQLLRGGVWGWWSFTAWFVLASPLKFQWSSSLSLSGGRLGFCFSWVSLFQGFPVRNFGFRFQILVVTFSVLMEEYEFFVCFCFCEFYYFEGCLLEILASTFKF